MRFTWDPAKKASNPKKHDGVTFEEVEGVFEDPHADIFRDRKHPERMIILGFSRRSRLLFVVHIELSGDVIRIISARKATPRERRSHER